MPLVGAALPLRRDSLLIQAREAGPVLQLEDGADTIVVTTEQDRLREII